MRKLAIFLVLSIVTLAVAIFGGPVSSGAVFLLLPTGERIADHELPATFVPLHKGAVDLATGLYFREDEDLVVGGTPALVLRRTYLSGYRVSKQFGIGATHNGELYLHGDLQQISLILARGTRITFDRTSPGSLYLNAMFEYSGRDWWSGSQLGWAGFGWALRHPGGDLMLFRPCGSGGVCSILQSRDADGHAISYRRDASGRLDRMESGGRAIAFEYDGRNRIVRATATTGASVAYAYDAAGRLSSAKADGREPRYTYSATDHMQTIADPGKTLENQYDANGRCTRQVVREPGAADKVFEFAYQLKGNEVVQTDMRVSDGEWTQYTFSPGRSVLAEKWSRPGVEPVEVTYERDAETDWPISLSVTCPDRKGLALRHTSFVTDGDEERVKNNLLSTHCYWKNRRLDRIGMLPPS